MQNSSILKELMNSSMQISNSQIQELSKLIIVSNSVFISGKGRSGLMIKAFANRLLHLAIKVNVIGEITCPALKSGDVLIINSASASNSSLINQIKIAKENNVKVVLITKNKNPKVKRLCDLLIVLKIQESNQPLGSLYEQVSFIYFEHVILDLIQKLNIKQNDLQRLHANIE